MSIDPRMRILLVEDSTAMRKMEKRVLKSIGLNDVVEAKDGKDAQSKLQNEGNIDFIISDWNMPNMDGLELVQWIRRNDKFTRLPFVMASGRGEKGEINKAKEAGVNSFVAKPFDADELNEVIREALGIKSEDDSADENEKSRFAESGKVRLRVAHIQITDHLVLGVLRYLIRKGEVTPKYFELETHCMPSWNPLAKALEKGTIDAACILAPIAMDLFGFGVPIKLILFAHKNGSIFVRNKRGGEFKEPYQDFFRQKSFYIPHMMSIHNVLAHMFFTGIGLRYGARGTGMLDVNFEIVPPIKMPELLPENPDVAGYLVAEPLGTKAIAGGNAELQFLSSELWDNHPCCVVTMQDEFIKNYSDAVQEFTNLLIHAGKLVEEKPDLSAEIAVSFLDPEKKLGLKVPILKNVLTEPKGIKTSDLYPSIEDLDSIQRYMYENMGIGNLIDVNKFVDVRFAANACKDKDQTKKPSVNHASSKQVLNRLLHGSLDDQEQRAKALLSKEGQYLIFYLNNQLYGINILKVKEIITLRNIESLPGTSPYFTGVMLFRGKTIPVLDLGILLGMKKTELTERSVIIVVETEQRDTTPLIGFTVEMVSEVIDVISRNIEKPVNKGVTSVADFVIGMTKSDQDVKTLIDLDILLEQRGTEDKLTAKPELRTAV